MSPTSPIFTDPSAGIPFGSRIESIGTVAGTGGSYSVTGGTSMVCDSIELNYPTKELLVPGQAGQPAGFALTKDQPRGSCTIQVPIGSATFNSTTGGYDGVTWPKLGQGFVDNFLATGEGWVIASLGIPLAQQGYYQVKATLLQRTQ
jgi:hypothetical protein